MRQLNDNGIAKVLQHLSVAGTVGVDKDGYFLEVENTDAVIKLLEDCKVKASLAGNKLRLMVEEAPSSVPAVRSTSTVADDNIKTAADEEAKKNGFDMNNVAMVSALADKLVGELSKVFPTKDEVNGALNALKQGSVQDKALVGGLEDLTANVKSATTP